MEQKLPMPQSSPEIGAYKPPEAVESAKHMPNSGEAKEVVAQPERESVAAAPPPPPPPALPQAPPVTAVNQAVVPAPQPIDDNPITAKDEELIEKEWVDKAKKIVQETRTDPYKQENKVSKLQADYIKKRYGKEVKLANH